MPDILFKFDDCRFSYRVAGICVHEGKVLLQSTYKEPEDYALPGGHAAMGELCSETLVREFGEEMGMKVEAGELLTTAEIHFNWGGVPCHQICLYFSVTPDKNFASLDKDFNGLEAYDGEPYHLKFTWYDIDKLDEIRLYPQGIADVIRGGGPRHLVYTENFGQAFEFSPVQPEDYEACAEVIRRGFGTVAKEFGLTRENTPTNGAFVEAARLGDWAARGNLMYKLTLRGKIIGFTQLSHHDAVTYELEKLVVLPEYRHNGAGKFMLEEACIIARHFGASRLTIGIIEENTRLRRWYERNGFIHDGTRDYGFRFTVGLMHRPV